MTPQELKNSIFFRAFSGHLVDRMYGEGTASELLKGLKLHAIIVDECRPEIPEHWRWTLLIDVASILYGFPFNSEKFNEVHVGKPLIRIRDILAGKTNTYTDEWCPTQYKITAGDMLIGMDGNFQVGFWQSEDAWLNQRVCKITTNDDFLLQKYLFYYLPLVLKEINGTVSYSTVKHLSAKLLNDIVIPLPPLAEQKRIVAKIEELLPLIDRYEKAWSRLEEFNRRFPADMQKSLLQMAIQGKLVEQRPEEGTGEELYRQIQAEKQRLIKEGKIKKEKPLPDIAEDELPFEIPENWKWIRLKDLATTITDCPHSTPKYLENETGYYAIVTKCINSKGEITRLFNVDEATYIKRTDRLTPQKRDIVYSREGSIVCRAVILPDKRICLGQRIMLIRCDIGVKHKFLQQYLMAYPTVQYLTRNYKGVGVKHINVADVCSLPLPLPPLNEQKRIVVKLEDLLPLCERLK